MNKQLMWIYEVRKSYKDSPSCYKTWSDLNDVNSKSTIALVTNVQMLTFIKMQ